MPGSNLDLSMLPKAFGQSATIFLQNGQCNLTSEDLIYLRCLINRLTYDSMWNEIWPFEVYYSKSSWLISTTFTKRAMQS